jgi:hypothetical protein
MQMERVRRSGQIARRRQVGRQPPDSADRRPAEEGAVGEGQARLVMIVFGLTFVAACVGYVVVALSQLMA